MTWLLSRSFFEKLAITSAAFGVTAGIMGPSDSGWYVAGVGAGLWLAAWGVWINE